MIRLKVTAFCMFCEELPPEGVDPDKWAEKHTKTAEHGTVTSGRPAT